MAEPKRYEPRIGRSHATGKWANAAIMVEMPSAASAPGWIWEADYTTLSREVERLRKVEADAQVTRNRLEAVERAVTAVSEAMMMRATRWKETQSAQWAGDALALFAVSLAEACGRKG